MKPSHTQADAVIPSCDLTRSAVGVVEFECMAFDTGREPNVGQSPVPTSGQGVVRAAHFMRG